VRRLVIASAFTAALVTTGATARADDIIAYQADGESDAAAANARVEALDEAFGKAVSQAVDDLVDAAARKQNKPAIDRELLGHARLWVAKFTVTKETVADDRKQLSVSVRVDRDKLRARLAELGIAARSPADAPAATGDAVTVLLRVATPDGMRATYGSAAETDVAGLAALSEALRRANFWVKRAPALAPDARPDGELPIDDAGAEAIAGEARTDLVAIAGITVGEPVLLRGIDASGVLVTARVRLVDRKAHRPPAQSMVVGVARGTAPGVVGAAIDRAVAAAAGDVLPAQPQQPPPAAPPPVFTGDDALVSEPGVVLVRLARATPWILVQAELKHLLGARGVASATLRHVSPAGWVIGVTTRDSPDRIASIAKKPPVADAAVAVKIVGSVVEVTVSSPPASPSTP